MTRFRLACLAGVALTASCSSGGGADVNAFPASMASSICHYYYHCCTPVDRQEVSDVYGAGFTAVAGNLGFDDEASCKEKLPPLLQTAAQPYQEEVARSRFTYDQSKAQACLDALNGAADKCDPAAFFGAQPPLGMLTDPHLPEGVYINDAGAATCSFHSFLKGKVAIAASCISDDECATPGAVCALPDAGSTGVPVDAGPYVTNIDSSLSVCIPPAAVAQQCTIDGYPPGTACGPGSCCQRDLDAGGFSCVSYVPENGPCSDDNIAVFGITCNNRCAQKPCDPVKDYCRANSQGLGGTCLARIADGQTCDSNDGQSPSCSCQHSCDPNGVFCEGQSHVITYAVCKGNPQGL
jgi:hypothetical protein